MHQCSSSIRGGYYDQNISLMGSIVKMDPMSGCDIRLVFTLPPSDSTLQYKRCVHLWNNYLYIIILWIRYSYFSIFKLFIYFYGFSVEVTCTFLDYISGNGETHKKLTSWVRKTRLSSTFLSDWGFKGTLVNRTLPSLHWGSLEIKLPVPYKALSSSLSKLSMEIGNSEIEIENCAFLFKVHWRKFSKLNTFKLGKRNKSTLKM